MRRLLALPVLAACLTTAQAEVWTDPGFARAVTEAHLIVRARAPKEGVSGAEKVTFRVLETWKGEAAATVTVGGLHDPTRAAGASFAKDAEVLLVLWRAKGELVVPTPTLGRYPIREGKVKYATLRDTYLRLDLPAADVRRYVDLLLGKRDEAWLAGLREALTGASADAQGDDLARLYLALESLARAGTPGDVPGITRCIVPAAPFQLRVSACRALAGAAGKRAAGRLLEIARSDPEPAVRTTAIGALGRLDPAPAGLTLKLVSLLDTATAEEVRFSRPTDPRLNKWPSPRAAILRVMTRSGAAPAKERILHLVASEQASAEVFTAALKALISLKGDPLLPRQLVRCFRAKEEVSSAVYNTDICAALVLITGDKAPGDDPEAWRAWANRR